MSVFAVIATEITYENITQLDKQISVKYVENCLKLKEEVWLVHDSDIFRPEAMYQSLFGDDRSVSCLILPFDAYWGVQPKQVWEWIKSKGL